MEISIRTKRSSELLFAEAGLFDIEKPKTEKKKETDKKCCYCFYCCFKKKSSKNRNFMGSETDAL